MQSSCSMPHNARENPGSRLEGNSSKATSLQLLPRRTLGRIFNWPEAERVRKAESLFSSSLKRSHATGLQDSNVWTNNGDVALCINLESTRGQEDRFEYFPQQFCPLANPHVSLNEGKMTSNKPVHTNGVAKFGRWLGSGSPKSIDLFACDARHTCGSILPSQSSLATCTRNCPDRNRFELPVCRESSLFLMKQFNIIGLLISGSPLQLMLRRP
ncbi:uncharacterized protein LOC119129529 isoform X3 [Syngnathus acus]|nr:uncharacterized protein LOC119129529 isoform X3 [Syngnathus acus]